MITVDFFKEPEPGLKQNSILMDELKKIKKQFTDAELTIIRNHMQVWYYNGYHDSVSENSSIYKFHQASMVTLQLFISGKNHTQKIKDIVKNIQPKSFDSSYLHTIIKQESNDKLYDIVTIRQINNNAQFEEFQIESHTSAKHEKTFSPDFKIDKQSLIDELRVVTTNIADTNADFEKRLDEVATALIDSYCKNRSTQLFNVANYIPSISNRYSLLRAHANKSKYLYYGMSSLMNYANDDRQVSRHDIYESNFKELPVEIQNYLKSFL